MNVHVSITGPDTTPLCFQNVLDQWRERFPEGKFRSISAYSGSGITLTLDMPKDTKVIVPQLVDARGAMEEEANG